MLSRLLLTASIAGTTLVASSSAFITAAPSLRSSLARTVVAPSLRQSHRAMSSIKAQGSPSDIVKTAIEQNKVMVFSKTWCPFCLKAKAALDSVGAKYEVLELDGRDDGGDIQDVFVDLTGARSVPRVFVNGKFIGGGDDVARLAESGELKKMIEV